NVTVALPHGTAACSIGVDPIAVSPQKTAAPLGVVVTRATHSRGVGASVVVAGATAAGGGATTGGGSTEGVPTMTATFALGRSPNPNSNPTIRHAAYGAMRSATRRTWSGRIRARPAAKAGATRTGSVVDAPTAGTTAATRSPPPIGAAPTAALVSSNVSSMKLARSDASRSLS